MKTTALVISCEHGGNEVPSPYVHLFEHHEAVLKTHRAFDMGALDIATYLCQTFQCDCTTTTITRLLIDCNRSLTNPHCFSEFTASLPKSEKKILTEQYYLSFRQQTENQIKAHITQGHQVLHLSIHSFTPELNGNIRNAAIGLLYDTTRHGEKEVARLWHELLLNHTPAYRIRKNYPYRGDSDGFTHALRKKYSEADYLGLEVESNQALMQDKTSFEQLLNVLATSLKDLLQLL